MSTAKELESYPVKYEKWFDEKGLFLDVYWENKDSALVYGITSISHKTMTRDEMINKGFTKQ